MKKFPIIFLLCFTSIYIYNCSKTEEAQQVVEGGFVSATINGKEYIFDDYPPNAGVIQSSAPPFFLLTITASDNETDINQSHSILIIINRKFDLRQLQPGVKWNSYEDHLNDKNEGIYISYSETFGSRDIEAKSIDEVDKNITIKITFIDKEKKIISGEFSGVLYDELYNELFIIENGIFENVRY